MLFSLINASTAFQQFMNDIFSNLLNICVIIYLDDILIYLANMSKHYQLLFFYFILFYFILSFFFLFLYLDIGKVQKILEIIMSYGMDNTCQPQNKHMVIRVGLKEYSTNHQQFVYKVDVLYLGTLLSSLVLLNIRVSFALYISLSHNIFMPKSFLLQTLLCPIIK